MTPYVELFGSRTRPAFDELGAAQHAGADDRRHDSAARSRGAARQFATRGPGPHLTLGGTIDALVGATWDGAAPATPKLAALQRVDAARRGREAAHASPRTRTRRREVRAMAELKIGDLRAARADKQQPPRRATTNGRTGCRSSNDFTRWIDKRELPKLIASLVAPPGDPFGIDPG